MKFITLINVKMPTTVGILIFISRVHITSECFKAGKFVSSHYFTFFEQLKVDAQLSGA